MATSDTSYQSHTTSEQSGRGKKHHCSKIRKIQSREVFLVLLWALAVSVAGPTVIQLAVNYALLHQSEYAQGIVPTIVMSLFCPLVGWLGDVHFGRYKILKISLLFAWINTAGLTILLTLSINITIPSAVITTASVLIILLMGFSYAAFLANGIPFAMDQMPAASGEQVSALINWYFWAWFSGGAIAELGIIAYSDNNQKQLSETQIYVLIAVLAILTIAISCGMIFHNNFTIEPQSRNPWKIVCNVLKYAATHKHPENRSALTYCEDDPPSRMDLGKNRYGGPYTTEEVEDVKTFLRIMAVILSFLMGTISYSLCQNGKDNLFRTLKNSDSRPYKALHFLFSFQVLIGFSVPFYEFIIYPFVRNRVPTMLKRIVISAFGVIIMSIYLLTIDIAGHYSSGHNITCIFNETHQDEMLPVNFAILSVPFQILLSSVTLLYNVSILQFICAQAPYSMKGLLTGLGFLVLYFSWCIAYVVQEVFYIKWEHRYNSIKSLNTSCDFWFFITTLLISIAGLVIVSLAAKWYKKREREDPNNDRMFVEAYYERYSANSSDHELQKSNM